MTTTDDITYNAWCRVCPSNEQGRRLIAIETRVPALVMVGQHFADAHPQVSPVVDGKHFLFDMAAGRCDVCNIVAEPPFWEYRITPGQAPHDADGRWAVCDPCHGLLAARDVKGVVARAAQVGGRQTGHGEHYLVRRSYQLLTADEAVIRRQASWDEP